MKIFLSAFILIFFTLKGFGQQNLLSFDEHNKYIYYQVDQIPGVSADTLLQRGLKFLKANPKLTFKPDKPDKVTGTGKFLVYGGVSVLRHEQGEIDYQLNVEFKDQKYRFWLTDFVFTPYQRDRYGNFVPQSGVDIPAEQLADKIDKKEAGSYLDEAGLFCKEFGDHLKIALIRAPAPKKVENTRKVVTDNW